MAIWIKLNEGHSLGEEAVKQFCKGTVSWNFKIMKSFNFNLFQLAHFKIPKYIEFVDSFPTTVTGKIQKFVMRDDLAKRLQVTSERSSASN